MNTVQGFPYLIRVATFLLLSVVANGQSLQTLVTYKGPHPSGICSAPPLTQSFLSTDVSVNVYFELNGVRPGDMVQVRWFDANHVYRWYTPWNPAPNGGASNRCYWTDLSIPDYISPYGFGQWQVQVYVNGTAVGVPYSFQVASTAAQPRVPDFIGSFDSVDCLHIYGWAKDNNNPDATISVDIYVDGKLWTTLRAGDSRSDLIAAGIGSHAFNEYSLPSNLHDGMQHSVRIFYSGTSTFLSGSPRLFQDTCGSSPSGASLSWANEGTPPVAVATGQQFTLTWQVTGPALIQSQVCWGTDPSAQNCLLQTGWQGGVGTKSVTLTAPIVTNLETYYFIVQARYNNQTFWSTQAHTLVSSVSLTNPSQWNFTEATHGSALHGFIVTLKKDFISGTRSQYTVYILVDPTFTWGSVNPNGLDLGSMAIVTNRDIGMVRGSYTVEVNYTEPSVLIKNITAGWQIPPGSSQDSDKVAMDVLGLIKGPTGAVFSAFTLITDVLNLIPTSDVTVSNWLYEKMQDENTYRVSRVEAGSLIGLFRRGATGIKFSLQVEEKLGLQPEFFVRSKNNLGKLIGVEIGLDRKALVSSGIGTVP